MGRKPKKRPEPDPGAAAVSPEELLLQHAYHDALTGLPNRVLFNYRLYEAIRRENRAAAQVKPEDLSGLGKIGPQDPAKDEKK